MSEQENIQLVKQCYGAFLSGDIDQLLKFMTSGINWDLPEVEGIACSGKRHGHDAVVEFFRIESELQQLREFRPMEFTAQGDRVVVTGYYEWTVKATQAEFGCEWCHVFHIDAGQIAKFTEFTDTHKVALAYQPQPGAMKGAESAGAGRPGVH